MDRGILYDMDDVIVDSHPLHIAAWDIVLQRYGHRFDEVPPAVRQRFTGKRVSEISREIVAQLRLDVTPEALDQERQADFMALAKKKLTLMAGVEASLKRFKKNGCAIALATSAIKPYLKLVLSKFALAPYFDAVVSGDEVKQGKPSPETFLLAAKKLKLKPNRCIVLEDAENGVAAAKAGGFWCVAVRSQSTPPQDLSAADAVAASLALVTDDLIEKILR